LPDDKGVQIVSRSLSNPTHASNYAITRVLYPDLFWGLSDPTSGTPVSKPLFGQVNGLLRSLQVFLFKSSRPSNTSP
jgi:hypothetical protein